MPSLILHPPAALLSLCLGLNPQLGTPQLSPGWGPGATASCVCLLSPCSGTLRTEPMVTALVLGQD